MSSAVCDLFGKHVQILVKVDCIKSTHKDA